MKKMKKITIIGLILTTFFFILCFISFIIFIISFLTYRDFNNKDVRYWAIMFITITLLLGLTSSLIVILEKDYTQNIIKRIKESPSKLLYFGIILLLMSVIIMVYLVLIVPGEKLASDFIPVMIILNISTYLALIFIIVGSKPSKLDLIVIGISLFVFFLITIIFLVVPLFFS